MLENEIENTDEVEDQSEDLKDQEVVNRAKERFSSAVNFWSESRVKAQQDLKMRIGDQWPQDVLARRQVSGRPVITINKIPTFVRQISNEMRMNKPSIKVYPVDNFADKDTAKIFQGIIRNIEYVSNAEIAYISAGEGAAEKSFGFFRVCTEYVSHDSFNQEIKIKAIPNHFAVQIDPNSVELDGSDMQYAFLTERMSITDFKLQYPKSKMSRENDWESLGADSDWVDSDSVLVTEYYEKTFETVDLVLLDNGESLDEKNLAGYNEFLLANGRPKAEVAKRRVALVPKVFWYKLNGVEILEKTEIPCEYIPVIPVYGGRVNVNGKWILESVHRYAQDSQMMYNYFASGEVEAIALAPKAPWVASDEQIPKEYEHMWANSNSENYPYLKYKSATMNGQLIPPPQRMSVDPAIGALSQARMFASDDIKASTGIYDASLGAKSQESSGVAIQRRNMQSQMTNYHFIDNLAKSIQFCGKILVSMIPRVYDTAMAVRILGENDEQEIVKINQEFEKNGEIVKYDLSKGKYDVVVEVGPSYATKRQEAAASMIEFTKAMPNQAPVIADLVVKNMDWPMASEIAERIKKTLPPELQDSTGDQVKIPPQIQGQLQQYEQMIDQLTAQLNEISQATANKKMELESKERIEQAKLQAQMSIELAKINNKEAMLVLSSELNNINNRLNLLDNNAPINNEFQDLSFNQSVGNGADVIEQNMNEEQI